FLATGTPADPPSPPEQATLILDHFHAMISHHGPGTGHLLARKHLSWFTRGLPGGALFRERVNHAPHPEAVLQLLHEFFDFPHQSEAA
ncbi:MAG: tRNA-dihydrouridine synthase, partial [Magnetococcales bacterium]|nr:tRNA-dihydrouridine synthase [Magnetococcales bacterium]